MISRVVHQSFSSADLGGPLPKLPLKLFLAPSARLYDPATRLTLPRQSTKRVCLAQALYIYRDHLRHNSRP